MEASKHDGETEWYAPPYRTVDGDTFEQLRAEVERQEEAAREAGFRPTMLRGPAEDLQAEPTRGHPSP